MKIGMRKPNLKKSIKARTTGKVKRQIKKSVNPMYGKKGMGYINDPKKAVYNKVYNKTTVGVRDIIPDVPSANHSSSNENIVYTNDDNTVLPNWLFTFLFICGIIIVAMSALVLLVNPVIGLIGILLGIFFIRSKKYNKRYRDDKHE